MSSIRFTDAEIERIKAAVGGAEGRTSGEIVPYIVEQSDRYEVAVWRGAAVLAVLALLVTMLVFEFYEGWGLGWLHTGWGTGLIVLAAGTLGAALARFVPPWRRLLAADQLASRVHARAMRAFVEEEVFKTRDRTGILLFVSILEHRIEVLGDEGINAKVTPDEWVEVVLRIREGIKQNHLADGLVDAIEMCGHLLERRGVGIRPDDSDELPNLPRIREE